MQVDIDFETRSHVDIKKCGGWRYAEDKSTEIICLYYTIDDNPIKGWHPLLGEPFPQDLRDAAENKNAIFYAHNAFFERCIWREKLTKGLIYFIEDRFTPLTLPDIPRSRWMCSAAVASAHALPRKLEKLCQALKTAAQKDMSGNRTMLKMSKPRKPTKNDKSLWHHKQEDFEKVYQYCADDVEAEHASLQEVNPLSPRERLVWAVDQCINDRGVQVDVELAEAAMRIHKAMIKRYNTEIAELTGGEVTAVSQVARLLTWFSGQGLTVNSVDKDALETIIANEALPETVRRVAQLRREGSKTSVGKYAAALRAADRPGRVHDLHLYHGAATGRWAGKLVQTQNLPRGVLASEEAMEDAVAAIKAEDIDAILEMGQVSTILSSAIRGMFIAAPDHDLFVADYAAIEARALMWLVGDENALTIFRSGQDIYKDMAATIYSKKAEDVTKDERQLGKQAILGLGYGMGWAKFLETCAGYGMDVTEELAKKVVDVFRSKYFRVKAFWYACEEAAIKAVETGVPQTVGYVTYRVKGKFLECVLPSGRPIRYYRPSVRLKDTSWGEEKMTLHFWGTDSMTGQWVEQTTYSGKLVENLTQAVARDLLAEALIAVETSKKYLPVLHVHDEVVAECKKGEGDVREFEALISQVPTWAEGLPLEAEGWVGKRYRK